MERKQRKEWTFPTFGNDSFLIPSVVAGVIYVYEIMIYQSHEAYLTEKYGAGYQYTANPWPVVIPFIVFIFCFAVYTGAVDVLTSLIKNSKGRILLAIGQKLAFGVLEQWEWQESRRKCSPERKTEQG
jgi:hypothetical protein